MRRKECLAMILAGGQGSRLGVLTKTLAKPAVPFGGKYRLIDFTLSNCYNSGFDTVGVLTQYQPLELHSYIGIGSPWDLDRNDGGVYILPPFLQQKGGEWYKGTANAIWQNASFIDQFSPDYLLVLSGDHIYKMDYSYMLEFHKQTEADATISVVEVPWNEAPRFGIMNTDKDSRITEFEEKPLQPKNNLASMGVYIFNWKVLRAYLQDDDNNGSSGHDFGKNVIPLMFKNGQKMMAYSFAGYWKDVGTLESLWQANMDLLSDKPKLDLYERDWPIYSVNPQAAPQLISAEAKLNKSLVSLGCMVLGEVENSVLFSGIYVGAGAVVKDSVILPGTKICSGAVVERAIVGQQAVIGAGCHIGDRKKSEITVVAEKTIVPENSVVAGGRVVE
ncbi:MAG: glucose-phosphate adenylyltransferase [Firmicutes bacterium]|nr:glucose-phosphate adenylyltransferase [Bacillota bacterium]